MVDGKHALVVVACVAGFGASAGVFVQEVGDVATYAEELFGEGSDARTITYPDEVTANRPNFPGGSDAANEEAGVTVYPWVKIYFTTDRNVDTARGDADLTAIEGATDPNATDPDAATFEIKFMLSSGMFAETVGAAHLSGPDGATISVDDGGNVDDDFVTFRVEHDLADDDAFTFELPRLKGLSGLGANDQLAPHIGSYAQADDVKVSTSTRLVTGPAGVPNGAVSSFVCPTGTVGGTGTGAAADGCNDTMARTGGTLDGMIVVADTSAVSLGIVDGGNPADIDIDKRASLHGGGARHKLGTMVLSINQGTDTANGAILQWNGEVVDDDLSGVIQFTATGDMGLFQDGDMVFADYDDDKSADANEMFSGEGAMLSFSGFSTDPDDVGSAARMIPVYYVPGGKMELRHGSSISLSTAIRFNDSTATPLPDLGDIHVERDVKVTSMLRYKGVGEARTAYAIPFDGNGKGDMANVRIRCETGAGADRMCRVFLECFDDMGMRFFGEGAAVAQDAVDVLSSAGIEMAANIDDAMSRLSCRVLTTGMSSVQTLVRDGSSGTLVNNSYVQD